jgi:putative phosphoribosyl transferase
MERIHATRDVWFEDRQEAGQALADALKKRELKCDVVLGLIRGGVPVAFEVAQALQVPLDILAVKKLRAPISEELAIGAICADGARILHAETLRDLEVSKEYLDREIEIRLAEAREAERLYRGPHPAIELAGQSVVIADDGIATGSTMEAGVLSARQRGASSILVATPVGSRHACDALLRSADEVFCMTTPVDFWAVGQFYHRFPPVADEEVQRMVDTNRRARVITG